QFSFGNAVWVDGENCKRANDCDADSCCVLSQRRHSYPQCKKLGNLNDPCYVGNKPGNFSHSYLNGAVVNASDVYTHFCPCKTGLTCLYNLCQKI
ncbi:astakine-like protein, partial [Dinothrombium tinctorium]